MSQPAHKIRIGVLQVTIWRNTGDKGKWYSVVPTRSYKQGDETWKETDSLGFDDLLLHGPGPDQSRFIQQFSEDVLPKLRERAG